MKGKRVLSLALAALMTLSLLVVPAAAVSFTDMTNHWAKDDVEYLATQGVVKGTSATTFAPDQKMTACEALLFCSRAAGVDAIDKEAIAEDWEDELKEILPEEMYAWAAQEMAVCLETGIISETELRALSSAGGLVKSITRETLAMYLVKGKGSDAGHNGLKHIAATLGTQDYARLRFGIGNDFPRGGQIDFVLGHFTDEDLKTMDERVATACDIIKSFCLAGISITMNQYNKK